MPFTRFLNWISHGQHQSKMVAYINAGDAADAEHLVRELFLVLGSTQSPMRSETVSVLESFKFSLRLARTGHATVCLN